jgi:hypothetical protein
MHTSTVQQTGYAQRSGLDVHHHHTHHQRAALAVIKANQVGEEEEKTRFVKEVGTGGLPGLAGL